MPDRKKKPEPDGFSDYLRELGRKGGKARLKTMTAEERSAVARRAAAKSAEVRSKNAAAKRALTQDDRKGTQSVAGKARKPAKKKAGSPPSTKP
jgi:hypothetical protein